MKFTIRNGATTLEFEGELDEFDRLAQEVDIPTDLLARSRADAKPDGALQAVRQAPEEQQDGSADTPEVGGSIDVRALAERLRTVEAKTDIDRITVMAYAALEARLPGLDYDTADRLFVELGERKPARIRATFQNAKARGLVRPAGRGMWAPTVAGENYARLGHRKQRVGSRPGRPNEVTT